MQHETYKSNVFHDCLRIKEFFIEKSKHNSDKQPQTEKELVWIKSLRDEPNSCLSEGDQRLDLKVRKEMIKSSDSFVAVAAIRRIRRANRNSVYNFSMKNY